MNNIQYCYGESKDGSIVCQYKNTCRRYVDGFITIAGGEYTAFYSELEWNDYCSNMINIEVIK